MNKSVIGIAVLGILAVMYFLGKAKKETEPKKLVINKAWFDKLTDEQVVDLEILLAG